MKSQIISYINKFLLFLFVAIRNDTSNNKLYSDFVKNGEFC